MKNLPNSLKAIGILQIIGGGLGVAVIIMTLTSIGRQEALVYMLVTLGMGLFLYSTACGVLLFTNTPKGIFHSRINQWLQVFKFMFGGFGYDYVSGIGFFVGVDVTRSLQIKFGMNVSAFHFNVATSDDNAYLSVNLIAILGLYILKRYAAKQNIHANAI